MEKEIPIQNIYYMLSYCAGILPEKDLKWVDGEDSTDLLELYVQSLIRQLKPFVKSGFYKEYILEQSELASLKGKILFKESVAQTSVLRGKLVCQYDVFSEDILHNQIIKTILHTLVTYKGLKKETIIAVKQLLPFFHRVRLIKLENKHFHHIKLHRNNKKYGFILDICYILFQNLLINEEEGTLRFVDYHREEKMQEVFEGFIRKFYEIRCRASFRVKTERFSWKRLNVMEGEQSLIPSMRTDITMIGENTKIIVNPKFEQVTLASNQRGEEKINVQHLYELFAFLSNIKPVERMIGILIYPEVDDQVNQIFEINGYLFKVMTVNLNEHWTKIDERLLEIVEV